uniref:C-type lectin domain-containing protein n=1 Tax=Anabas testudineus TaxID=64144 RepID=A0A3Q1HIC8_ANATE
MVPVPTPTHCNSLAQAAKSIQRKLPFLCLSLYVIEKQVTWEEAIWNCRETHYTLTSLVSEAENRLALREIQDRNITDPVWIGLRYLFQTWLWVDGSPLVYTAGPQGKDQDYQCPTQSNCAALTSNGNDHIQYSHNRRATKTTGVE